VYTKLLFILQLISKRLSLTYFSLYSEGLGLTYYNHDNILNVENLHKSSKFGDRKYVLETIIVSRFLCLILFSNKFY